MLSWEQVQKEPLRYIYGDKMATKKSFKVEQPEPIVEAKVEIEQPEPIVQVKGPLCFRCGNAMRATGGGRSGTDYHCDNCGSNITI